MKCNLQIFARRFYRAFPELDRLDDRECEHLIARMERRYSVALTLCPALVAIAGVVVGIMVIVLIVSIDWPSSALRAGVIAAALPSILLGAALPAIVTHDFILRRRLRKYIYDNKCPKCAYSAIGLPHESGLVTCPECGERFRPESARELQAASV